MTSTTTFADGVKREASPRAEPTASRWLALAVLCVPLLITSLDTTVLNVALPTIVRKLHATDSQLQWIVDAYILVFGGLLLVSGSLADRVGRKRTFLAGLMVFAVCSLFAAFSGSSAMLIAARACMGIGGTLIMPPTLSIITNMFSERGERQRALGIWAASTGAGTALGPIVGGLLLAHFAWGSVFLINVPIALLAFAFGVRLVPDSRDPRPEAIDTVGALLSVAGLGLLLWAIIEAPVHGWTSAEVLGTGIGGVVVLAVFVLWEARSPHPMLRLQFFRSRRFSGAVFSVALLMFALVGLLFVLTQWLQFQLGYSALQAGVRMLPAAGGIVLVAPLSPVFVRRLGTKLTVALGLAIAAGGVWQIAGVSVASTYPAQLPGAFMLGIGTGMVMPACTGSLMGTLPLQNTGVGSATNGTFLQVGSALGVAIVGSILSTRYQDKLAPVLAGHAIPATIRQEILGSLGGALGAAHHIGGTAGALLSQAARTAFIAGMDDGLQVCAAVAAGGVVIALVVLPLRPAPAPPRDVEQG